MESCPVCGGAPLATGLSVRTDRSYRVATCPDCGLAYTTPRPTVEQIDRFYGETYFSRSGEKSRFGYEDYEGASWAAVNAERSWDELPQWAPQVSSVPRTLLDVGAGTGSFAKRATLDGWQATACEIGDTARERAAALGLPTVRTLAQAEGEYGLITMYHVLEHLLDPVGELRAARALIHHDGILAIEVPNWYSAGRLIRGARWSQLKPPEHINFFSRRSVRSALARAGWHLVAASTPYPRAGSLAIRAAREGHGRESVSQAARWIAGLSGTGGYLRVVARPARELPA